MKELRRNEFIDMLEMAEVLFEEKDNYISCDIPSLGKLTYYPKADKINVHIGNEWFEDGFRRVRLVLNPKIEIDKNYIDNATSIIKRAEKSDSELRNEYAGLAMKGLMTIQDKEFFDSTEEMAEKYAEISFIVADAMVKRSKIK